MSELPVKRRGRPRKADHELKRPRREPKSKAEEVVFDSPVPVIEVGDTQAALAELDEVERAEIDRESKKAALASDIAKHRWTIAQHIHRLEDGKTHLDFRTRPFLEDIYKDPSPDIAIIGSAQYGKTEVLLCDAFASSGLAGLKVLWVCSKMDKRNRFVTSRVDPCLNSVPQYRRLFQAARERNATADSTAIKHFGAGSIFFIFASAEREFTSWSADKVIVDEHQECDQNNLAKLPDRLSGSPWGFMTNAGHPSIPGSEQNQNLDYIYQQGDAREWYVPCPHCGLPQVLDWWTHCIYEEKNEHGAILSVKPRDEDYRPGPNALDMRPVCAICHRPMNRLSREGFWKAQHPDRSRHSYRLSNLYNVNVRIDKLFARYAAARHRPELMSEFYNKQLGICFSMSGTRITEEMLAACSTGDHSGVKPYIFKPVSEFAWRKIVAA